MSDDPETIERRFRLWFFRELSDTQRSQLFNLCFYPIETPMTHAHQAIALKRVLQLIGDKLPPPPR